MEGDEWSLNMKSFNTYPSEGSKLDSSYALTKSWYQPFVFLFVSLDHPLLVSKTKDKDNLTRFRKKVFESWTDVLDTAPPPLAQGATAHTRISHHYFFHSTIILTLRVSRMSRDAKKFFFKN